MKLRKFLLTLVPILAFMLVACGGLFDAEEEIIDDTLPQEDEFIINEEIEIQEPEAEDVWEEDQPQPDVDDTWEEDAEEGMMY